MLLIRDPKGHGRGQADTLWIPRRSGHIYMGPSPLCDTLSYRHSSPPMEEPTNTTAWTSSASATPSMTSPSTVSTGFSSCYTRSFTKNNNISRDTGSRSVSFTILSAIEQVLFELLSRINVVNIQISSIFLQ